MAKKLLDTTFLIHYWGGRESVADYLNDHEDDDEFLTGAVNVKELAVGRLLQGGDPAAEIPRTFDWLRVVPLNSPAAIAAAHLEADLRRATANEGEIRMLAGDVLIAGIAQSVDAIVVTRNTDDFRQLGVDTEAY